MRLWFVSNGFVDWCPITSVKFQIYYLIMNHYMIQTYFMTVRPKFSSFYSGPDFNKRCFSFAINVTCKCGWTQLVIFIFHNKISFLEKINGYMIAQVIMWQYEGSLSLFFPTRTPRHGVGNNSEFIDEEMIVRSEMFEIME